MCTAEDQPCLVHAGPFANIAVGQSSVVADKIGLKLVDYHVTESGFGADIGFEKFWNVKCRYSGLKPHVSVLHHHHPGPEDARRRSQGRGRPGPARRIHQGKPGLVENGMANMVHRIEVIRKAGINPVVCINAFHTDTKAEIAMVRKNAEQAGARWPSPPTGPMAATGPWNWPMR